MIVREEAERGEASKKKHNGGRRSEGIEGRIWEQAAKAIGPAPRARRWIHVSDRESDVFEYLAVCHSLGKEFVVRAFHDRKVNPAEEAAEPSAQSPRYLMRRARTLVARSEQTYAVEGAAASKKGRAQSSRHAQIRLAWTQLHLPAPSSVKGQPGLKVWLVRAWEPPPRQGRRRWSGSC